MKRKCPAELNSKVIRINVGTYQLLRELSLKLRYTMAETLDKLLTQQDLLKAELEPEPVTIVPKAQIPMLAFQARPQPAFRVSMAIPLRVTPQSTVATNGHKAVTIGTKVKGVRYA